MVKFVNLKTKKYYPVLLFSLFLICLFFGVGASFSNSDLPLQNISQKQAKPINKEDILKIVHISDVHLDSKGVNKGTRRLADSKYFLDEAVKRINEMKDVDMVIFSGDNVNRPKPDDLMTFFKSANKLKYPWYITPGNHDIAIKAGITALTKKKFILLRNSHNQYINSCDMDYTINPKKGYKVMFMDGVIDTDITAHGSFSKAELTWLREQLSKYKKDNVIIVQHFPLVEPFESRDHTVLNDVEYLNLLNKHKNVIALLSGHYHATKLQERNGVIHVSTPALVQSPHGFRVITFRKIKDKKIEVKFDFFQVAPKKSSSDKKAEPKASSLSKGSLRDRETEIILNKDK